MRHAVHIKVCGITNLDDADLCVSLQVSSIGLNLIPSSKRYVDRATARRIVDHVRGKVHTVAVVADLEVAEMRSLLGDLPIDCLQLHGDEPPQSLHAMLPHAYKALRIGCAADVEEATRYSGEYLLVDAKVEGQLGGTGHRVDFELVAPLAKIRRLTLAGGLTSDNVADAIARVAPYCVDVASGVEDKGAPRKKAADRVAAFCAAVRGTVG